MMRKNLVHTILVLVVFVSSFLLSGCVQPTAERPTAERPTAESTTTTATWTLEQGWQVPVSVPENFTQDDWYDMGWETFIALNWPAQWASWPNTTAPEGIGGQPNENMSIKTATNSYPAVWQTYVDPEQVFLDEGADPGSWTALNNPLSTEVDSTGTTLPVLGGFSKGIASSREKLGEFNEATNNPLIAQDGNFVNYEIRMNQSEFTYLINNKYYDAANQEMATAEGSINSIPVGTEPSLMTLPEWAQQGATEIKASWRIITNTEFADRYFTMWAFRELPDGTVDGPHLFGLVGLHILRLTPNSGSTWYWATFEQVDNVEIDESSIPTGLTPSFNPGTAPPYPTYTYGFEYNGQHENPPDEVTESLPTSPTVVNTSRIANAIQSGAVTSNEKYHAMLPDTSVWQYYKMIGVLNPWVSGSQYSVPPFDNLTNSGQLANTTMETYFQVKKEKVNNELTATSCFSCHAFATPAGAKKDANNYPAQPGNQIFTFLFDDAKSSQ